VTGDRNTIREVAARAGVSQATAARALGGYGYVRAATGARVREAAAELGYRPNDVARALASGSSKALGLIVGDVENAFFASVARGLADVADNDGYTLVLANSDEDLDRERRAVEAFSTRLVDGIVASPVAGGEVDHLRRLACPLVLVDRTAPRLKADTVVVDNARGAAMAVEHLAVLGHRSIGIVSEQTDISSVTLRVRGYRRALRDAGLPTGPALESYGTATPAGGYDAAMALLTRAQRPTAVVTATNFMTAGTVRAMRELGLRWGHDVALVAFDDVDWAMLVEPNITVVAQPVFEIGRAAGQRMIARLSGDTSAPKRITLPTQLIVRGSCGARS
jgi:LacI family transcriptional regulator